MTRDVGSQRGQVVAGDEGSGGGDDAGERRGGHVEELQQPGVPGAGAQVEQLRAGRVARLDEVLAADPPQQPRVDGAQAQLARAAPRPVGVVGVQQRRGLGRGEHRVQRQTREVTHPVGVARVAQPCAQRGPPGVLPAEQGADGLARGAVPEQHRLALGAQADGGDLVHLGGVEPGEREADRVLNGAPDLEGVLLGPARSGEGLRDRHGRLGPHLAGQVDDDGLGGARPLVHRQHELAARTVHAVNLHSAVNA